jgi:hypothetical protein
MLLLLDGCEKFADESKLSAGFCCCWMAVKNLLVKAN